jgi:hypothetical protein
MHGQLFGTVYFPFFIFLFSSFHGFFPSNFLFFLLFTENFFPPKKTGAAQGAHCLSTTQCATTMWILLELFPLLAIKQIIHAFLPF